MLHYYCIFLILYLSYSPPHKRKGTTTHKQRQQFCKAYALLEGIIRPTTHPQTNPATTRPI